MASTSSMVTFNAKPPKLSGNLLSVYFQQLGDYFDVAGISDDSTKLAVFRMGLQAPEYKRFCIDHKLPSVFDEAEKEILDLYDPQPTENTLCNQFLTALQYPGESVLQYSHRLTSCSKAYPSLSPGGREILIFSQLGRGLSHSKVREAAKLSSATDLKILVGELSRLESVVEEEASHNSISTVNAVSTISDRLDSLERQLSELTNRMVGLTTIDRRPNIICWNCGLRGHTSHRCRQNKATCPRCQGGHLETFCNTASTNNTPDANRSSEQPNSRTGSPL